MEQLKLPMWTVYEGPELVDIEIVIACKSYRAAVRACWERGQRRRPGYTKAQLAEDIGSYPSHVTDYLHADDAPHRRDLPAKRLVDFENEMGNRLVSQWIAHQARLPMIDAATDRLLGALLPPHQVRRAA